MRAALDFLRRSRRRWRFNLPSHYTSSLAGGGFGVGNAARHKADLDVPATLRELAAAVRERATARGYAPPRIGVEPGRALIARAGTMSLYSVLAVKDQGRRRFAIVDGGIADNPRPALYGAYHHPGLGGAQFARGYG